MEDIYLPAWVIYSLPDGLWMFAFAMSALSIWNFKLNDTSGKWIYSVIFIGIGFELMQGFVNRMGVFDWKDLFIMIVSASIAITLFTNKKATEKNIIINPS